MKTKPYDNPVLLRKLYIEDGLSSREIGKKFGVSKTPILDRLDRYDIEKRPSNRERPPSFGHGKGEHEKWQHRYDGEKWNVFVHRLLAVAEFGFDAVIDRDVHHKNEIPWDNRPENLVVSQTRLES